MAAYSLEVTPIEIKLENILSICFPEQDALVQDINVNAATEKR